MALEAFAFLQERISRPERTLKFIKEYYPINPPRPWHNKSVTSVVNQSDHNFWFDPVYDDSLEPITPSASAISPRRLSTRMKTLITNTHAGKTRINQAVRSLLTSSSNATA
jgi:hypothetical protein